MSIARKIGNVADVLDSAASGDFFAKGSTDGQFQEIAYSSLVGTPTAIDSALTTQLIDSSYIQLRQTSAAAGLDSATTINLIDSSYVAARSSSSGSSGFDIFNYTATNNQTTFQDSSNDGTVLSYTENGILVYYNGLLLADEDYTATSGSSVVLTSGADSGASLAIAKWSLGGGGGGASIAWGGDTGMCMRSSVSGNTYFSFASAASSNAAGNLTTALGHTAMASDKTYGVIGGGYVNGSPQRTNVIDRITFASPSNNAADFGDLTVARTFFDGACDGSRALFMGGYTNTNQNVIDYVTPASAGNAADFGDLTTGRGGCTAGNDATYALAICDFGSGVTIDYVTIQTAANAADFGDLNVAHGYNAGGCSDATRTLFGGGTTAQIDYLTTATPGNGTDFGDLTVGSGGALARMCAASNGTTAMFMGGESTTNMQYVTIQTPGNSVDWNGDLQASSGMGLGGASGT